MREQCLSGKICKPLREKSREVKITAVLGKKECEVQLQYHMHVPFGMSKNSKTFLIIKQGEKISSYPWHFRYSVFQTSQ